MHGLESNKLIKYNTTLTLKALYPSNIERQQVSPALKIFNNDNILSLEEFGPHHEELYGWEDTCQFLKIIEKWWKIVNVKVPGKGRRLLDQDFDEIIKIDQPQLLYLKKYMNGSNLGKEHSLNKI